MSANLYDLILKGKENDERICIQSTDFSAVSYKSLIERCEAFAGALRSLGAKPGDRVAAQTDKSPDAIALFLATIKAGLVYVPLNTAYTDTEMSYFLSDSAPTVFVTTPENRSRFNLLLEKQRCNVATLADDGTGTLSKRSSSCERLKETHSVSNNHAAAILYTSGTTGQPKGAVITHKNLCWSTETLVREWEINRDDVLVHALPLFHAHGLFLAANLTLAAGGRIILHKKFDPEACIADFAQATVFMGVPTLYKRLLAQSNLTKTACQNMRLFTAGSAPLSQADFDNFYERVDHKILERYGMTETVIICSNPLMGERIAGSVGYPLPDVEVRIRQDNRTLESGEVGMLEVRGPNVFREYLNKPDKTWEEFTDDGFLITGDLARQDKDGRIWLVGRAKELIISGGYNVYPKEVERIIDEFPGVARSAVVGVPHPDFGEGVIAVVELESGATIDPDAVIVHTKSHLARYKVPKYVFIETQLPTTSLGKVVKAPLGEKFADVFIQRKRAAR